MAFKQFSTTSQRIGITERGDASRDFSWLDKLDRVGGVVLITKALTDKFCDTVLALEHEQPGHVIVHATCTGWGATQLEPGLPFSPIAQTRKLAELIDAGFPQERTVLRIDPIIPPSGFWDEDGILKPAGVLIDYQSRCLTHGIDFSKQRVRVSLIDDYPHVKARMRKLGLPTFYPGNRKNPTQAEADTVAAWLTAWHHETGVVFETCAEPLLHGDGIVATGCIGQRELDLLGLHYDNKQTGFQRNACLCLGCKTELLENRRRCPNGCLYCYWR